MRVRFRRRLVATVSVLVLLIAFFALLVYPFQHPHTNIAVLTAADYQVLQAPPIDFAANDAEAFEPLAPSLRQSDSGPNLAALDQLSTARGSAELGPAMAAMNASPRDVLLIYCALHGISDDGQAYVLSGDFLASASTSGVVPLKELLHHVTRSQASVKLLILDAGRLAYEPRLGVVANEFPRLLEQQIHDTGDSTLWVFSANQALEQSRVSPGIGRSVFGFFVTHALRGGADFNRDQAIDLGELERYVSSHVAAWVRQTTEGTASQTPALLWGGGKIERAKMPVLLSIRPLLEQANEDEPVEPADLAQALADARRRHAVATFPVPSSMQPFVDVLNNFSNNRNSDSDNSSGPPSTDDGSPQGSTAASDSTSDDSAPAQGNNGSSDETTTDKEADAEEVETAKASTTAVRIAQRIVEGWELRDKLREQTANPGALRHVAPHLWRELEQSLIGCEQRLRSGSRNEKVLLAEVEQDLRILRASAASRPMRSSGYGNTLAARVAKAQQISELPAVEVSSLGLAEELTEWGRKLSPDELGRVEKFDAMAASATRNPLDKWSAEEWTSADDQYAELRLAKRLADASKIDWQLLQRALQTRRLAEQVAARSGTSDRAQLAIARADELRQQGEQELLDQIGGSWQTFATARFTEASQLYRAVADQRDQLGAAKELCDDLLYRLPNYVRWRYAAGQDSSPYGPDDHDLLQLCDALQHLLAYIDEDASGDGAALWPHFQKLVGLRKEVEAGIDGRFVASLIARRPAPGDGRRIAGLLSTPLLDVGARVALLNAASQVDWETAQQLEFPDHSLADTAFHHPTPKDWQWVVGQLELEVKLLQLASRNTDGEGDAAKLATDSIENVRVALQQLEQDPLAGENNDAMWLALRSTARDLRAFYQALPSSLDDIVKESSDLSDSSTRGARLNRLRAAARALAFVDGRDAHRVESDNPFVLLRSAELYDLLAWQSRRAAGMRQYSPRTEIEHLTAAAQRYRQSAMNISNQPPLPSIDGPELDVQVPNSLSLTTTEQGEIEISLRSRSSTVSDVWITARYDRDLLDVRGDSDQRIYSVANDSFDLTSVPPTVQLRAGVPRTVRVLVRRISAASHASQLIVNIVTRDGATRRDIVIPLPLEDAVRLIVRGTPGTWTDSGAGVKLHPFPNRVTPYQFALVTDSDEAQVVDVAFVVPGLPPARNFPRETLPANDVKRLLKSLGPMAVVAELKEVALPGAGEPVLLPFPEPSEESDAGTSTKPTIENGLLLVVTDKESGWKSIHAIELQPQRPRRFLQTHVSYDLSRQRIDVEATPLDKSHLPPGGVKLRVEVVQPMLAKEAAVLEGEVKAPDYKVNLSLKVPPAAGQVVTLRIHVDGYPRAFLYQVPCDSDVVNVPEWTDAFQARITTPDEGAAYGPGNETVPARVEVDAPRGAFDEAGSFVDVGFDRDLDREFRGDSPLRMHADRNVAVELKQVAPDGLVAVETRVDDLQVDVPAFGLQNVRANLLARVQFGDRIAWSEPIEVMFDAAGPELREIEIRPGRFLVIGDEMSVIVEANDRLSGVKQVEAAIDVAGTGQLGGDNTSVAAVVQADGRWLTTIPTGELKAGNYFLLLRGTDFVGNASEVAKVKITVITTEQAAQRVAEMKTRVSGSVTYGNQGQARIVVVLAAEDGMEVAKVATDDDGNFAFAAVPPGKFKLSAVGVVRNKTRTAKAEVEIKPGDKPKRIALMLE